MASRVGELRTGPVRASTAALSRRRPFTLAPPMVWIIAIPSAALLVIYCVWYSANEPEMDFQVYRMGGRHILGSGLYSSQIEVLGRHLSFTYPPLAALLFWPISHFSVFAGQVLWDAINLAALIALIAVSIAAARCGRLGSSDWRTALALLLPVALLLYPVRSDLALGQINIVLILMIVVDLTTELSWRGHSFPHGVLVGLAAAIKLTPLVFIPYLVVSRQWRAAGNATLSFILVTGALFATRRGCTSPRTPSMCSGWATVSPLGIRRSTQPSSGRISRLRRRSSTSSKSWCSVAAWQLPRWHTDTPPCCWRCWSVRRRASCSLPFPGSITTSGLCRR
jgi:hypothetical protein